MNARLRACGRKAAGRLAQTPDFWRLRSPEGTFLSALSAESHGTAFVPWVFPVAGGLEYQA